MEVILYRTNSDGNTYFIRNSDGRVIGRVDWIMAGDNVGVHCYSHDPQYKPPKIRKLFRHNFPA